MNKLKRILSLTFLTLMLGIPIYSLTTYYQEVQAAEATSLAKIRRLNETYENVVYKAGGQVSET